MARRLSLTFATRNTRAERDVVIRHVVIAGWTGRDRAAVEKHIAELEAIGVKRPATTPIFYRVAAARLTTEEVIEVSGDHSSGEVEFTLLQADGRLWVGVGSDHTDRQVETYGVTVSKQLCDKPVATEFWDFENVAPHWDRLILRSRIGQDDGRVVYQEGPLSAILAPQILIGSYSEGAALADGTLMFCGTLPVRGGIRTSDSFEFEIEDPVLGRTIGHRYRVIALPVLG